MIVGHGPGRLIQQGTKERDALINELVVSQAYRGRGIGQALVAKARDEALSRGMDEIEVGTEQDNLAARSLYQKCGFDQEYVLLGLEFEGG